MTSPVSIMNQAADIELAQPIDINSPRTTPLANDLWIYRFAILTLGMLALLALGGSMALTALGREAPQVSVALGSAAVGALAGLLTPSPARG